MHRGCPSDVRVYIQMETVEKVRVEVMGPWPAFLFLKLNVTNAWVSLRCLG